MPYDTSILLNKYKREYKHNLSKKVRSWIK